MTEGSDICVRCGATGDDANVRSRHILNEGRVEYCSECYADHIYDETFLSQQQATMYALKHSSMTYAEIADDLDIETNTVQSQFARIREKIRKASRTIDLVEIEV